MRRAIWLLPALTILVVLIGRVPIAVSNTVQWQPINPEDLAMKDNPAQPGSDAMILYREDFVNEKFVQTDGPYVDEYFRYKIFTEKGVRWGDVEIPFLKDNSDVIDLSARTIQTDGTIVNFEGKPFEKEVVKASGFKFLAKTFTLPNVKPGCIIEFRYRLQFKPNYLYDEHWTVSQEVFTREGHFSISPFTSDYYFNNFPLYFRLFRLPKDDLPKRQPDGSYTMTVHDIPGVEDEPLMLPRGELEARVEFFHLDPDKAQKETDDQFWSRMAKKWDDSLEHFIGKKSALSQDLSQTVASNDPPEVKLQKIYARVQKIRNLNFEESRSKTEMKQENLKEQSSVEDVLKNGYGYGRQINFLFVGLARTAGFDSTIVYVAPRDRNAFYPAMQDVDQVDDDIVWAKAGDKEYWLDPADKYCPFPMLPWNETGTMGVRISKQGGQIVQTPPPKASDATTIRTADLQIDDSGNATGKITVEYGGQIALSYREDYRKDDETGRKKNFEELLQSHLLGGPKIEITNIADWDDTSKPVHVEATILAGGFATPTGHRFLVPSTPFQETMVRNFEAQLRTNDIYFHYPYEVIDTVTVHAPDGFTVESLPPAKKDNPGAVLYEYTPSREGNTVVLKRHLVQNVMIYEVKYYSALRAFFNSVKSNDNAQIVFSNSPPKGD